MNKYKIKTFEEAEEKEKHKKQKYTILYFFLCILNINLI